jgi:NADH-quinone oxidoreductase subunit N
LLQILLVISVITLLFFLRGYTSIANVSFFEYDSLISLSILGLFFLSKVNDLIVLYLAIELQSLAFYVLATYWQNSEYASESGVKYFVLGSFSSCLLLLGLAITFLTTGSLNFNEIAQFTLFYDDNMNASILGFLLLLSAFMFKLGAFPFHM